MHCFSMHSNYYYNAYLRRGCMFNIIYYSYYNKKIRNCFNKHFILCCFHIEKD